MRHSAMSIKGSCAMRETRAFSIAPSAMLAASARTDPAARGALDSVVDALAAKTFLLPVDHMRGGEGEGGSDASVKWKILNNRREGDETETCIDIISAGTEVCHKFNIGPGDDAEMPYKCE